MKQYLNIFCVLIVVSSVMTVGCGKRSNGLVPAEGVVTFNGEPVAGATILLSPIDLNGIGASAQAVTDDNGKFKMTTRKSGDGVRPADYRACIIKDVVSGGLSLEETKARMENPDKYRNEKTPEQTVVHELPAVYSDINTSGLDITIPKKGKKDIVFALEGEVDLTPESLSAGHDGGR